MSIMISVRQEGIKSDVLEDEAGGHVVQMER
jgi:hypothetical protein